MKALDELEKRIGLKLPATFSATYRTRNVLTAPIDWEIFEPARMFRTRGGEYRIASERRFDVPIDALVIGHCNEAPLFLVIENDTLSESLWTWEHQETEPTRVAGSLEELIAGDGVDDDDRIEYGADTDAVEVTCPFCASVDLITIDPSGGHAQTFVEDCASCCHPRVVHVEPTGTGGVRVWVERA